MSMASPDRVAKVPALLEFAREARGALGSRLLDLKLYGSYAKGTATAESDIDVLVIVDRADRQLEDRVFDIAYALNLTHGIFLSPFVVDTATLEHPVWRHLPFLKTVQREGIRL